MKKIASLFILVQFVATAVCPGPGWAQTLSAAGLLPEPGTPLSLSGTFTPAHLQGMVINPADPFKFDFIIHRGDEQLAADRKQAEYTRLIKYFLAALAVPDQDQWVNLSPYEKDRIIPDGMGLTEMGRDLLAQDYILKQLTASLSNPDSAIGRKFWDTIYARAYQKLGTTDIPTDVFNKVWILPDTAEVYEKNNTMVVIRHHLKVMLDSDYQAMKENAVSAEADTQTTELSRQVMREVILPVIEKEVNEGRNFAPLRQVYSGMLLATWYKTALKESILGQLYADKQKVKGVDQDPVNNQRIYDRYVEAFRRGVVNMIREDVDKYSNEVIPRKYFSGGFQRERGVSVTDSPEAAQLAASVEESADFAAVRVKDPQEDLASTADSAAVDVVVSVPLAQYAEDYPGFVEHKQFWPRRKAVLAFEAPYRNFGEERRFALWDISFVGPNYQPGPLSSGWMKAQEKLARKYALLLWEKEFSKLKPIEQKSILMFILKYSEFQEKKFGLMSLVYLRMDLLGKKKQMIFSWLLLVREYEKRWAQTYPQAVALIEEVIPRLMAKWEAMVEPEYTHGKYVFTRFTEGDIEAMKLMESFDGQPEVLVGSALALLQSLEGGTLRGLKTRVPADIAVQQERFFREVFPDQIGYQINTDPEGRMTIVFEGIKSKDSRLAKEREDRNAWMNDWAASPDKPLSSIERLQVAAKPEALAGDPVGGIDFARSNLNMRIKRDGAGVPLPASQQDLDSIHINGLVPEILSIQPLQPGQIIR